MLSAEVLCSNMLDSWDAGHFDPSQGKEKAIKKAQEFYKQDAIFDVSFPSTKSSVFKIYHGPQGIVEWCGGVTEKFEFRNFRSTFAYTSSDEVVYSKNTWGPLIHKSSGKIFEEELSVMQEHLVDNGKIKYAKIYWGDAAHIMDEMLMSSSK